MDDIMIDFGVIQIKWYSFFIFLGMSIASILIIKESKKKEVPEVYITNLLFYGILIGILGARIYYVLFNINYYLKNPIEIIQIWNGGLAIHGGILLTLLFIILYSKKNNINTLLMTDIISVGLLIAQSIGRWGNFFNKEAYGRIVTKGFLKKLYLPSFIIEGMYIDGFYREPTFLYESIISFFGFILLLIVRNTKKNKTGNLTGIYLIWYGIERLVIESFRSDSLMLGHLKIAQLISLIAILFGIYFITKKNNLYKEDKIIKY